MKRAIALVLWITAAGTCFPAQAPALKSGRNGKNADAFVSGPPLTLEQVLRLAGQDAIPLRRRKEAIQNRGIDFSLSAELLNKIKASGATDELIEAIKAKARPVLPATGPKPAVSGGMIVTCAPSDCEVWLNGVERGSTQNGSMELAGVPPGKWVVDITKKGYIGHQSNVSVKAGETVSVSAVLEPDRTTKEAYGAELFKKMLQSIGGPDGLRDLATIQATGSASLWARDGSSVRWTVRIRNRPDRGLFQVKAGNIAHEVAFTGTEFKASKNLKGPEALELPTDFGLIRDNWIAALITRLQEPKWKLIANSPAIGPSEEFTLFAEAGTEKIAIGVDSELRPQRVRITTATGVGSMLITYSDYARGEKASYPKTIQIKPDGRENGVEVRFDTVELNPKLKDGDFKLKGGPFSSLWN
jgi:PEGA domain-containing protein